MVSGNGHGGVRPRRGSRGGVTVDLADYIVQLVLQPTLLEAFRADPQGAAPAAGLTRAEADALISGDPGRIRALIDPERRLAPLIATRSPEPRAAKGCSCSKRCVASANPRGSSAIRARATCYVIQVTAPTGTGACESSSTTS